MAKILCITLNPAIDITLSIDTLKVGAVNRVANSQTHPAGKGINVASILAQLGHDITVTGFLGQQNRQSFDDKFSQLNFDNQFVYVAGETRQNIKIAENNGQMTDINGKGFLVDERAKDELLTKIDNLAKQHDFIVMSGSLPQGFSLDDFANLMVNIQQKNPKLAIDTSGEALKIAIKHNPFLIKPNTDELAESFGVACQTLDEQIQLFQKLNSKIEHIVISMGEKGVHWLKRSPTQQTITATSPKVTVKSTVGAGDTLVAGMVHGLLSLDDERQILTQAVAMASHAVTIIGFDVANQQRLTELSSQIQII